MNTKIKHSLKNTKNWIRFFYKRLIIVVALVSVMSSSVHAGLTMKELAEKASKYGHLILKYVPGAAGSAGKIAFTAADALGITDSYGDAIDVNNIFVNKMLDDIFAVFNNTRYNAVCTITRRP